MLVDDRMDDMTGLVGAEEVVGFPPTFSWSSTAKGSNVISDEWYAWSIKISRKEQ